MSLKHKIIKNPQLYKFFVVSSNLRYFFVNSKSISGKNNSVKIAADVLQKNIFLKISGQNNNLIVKQWCRFKKVGTGLSMRQAKKKQLLMVMEKLTARYAHKVICISL